MEIFFDGTQAIENKIIQSYNISVKPYYTATSAVAYCY